MDRQPLGSPVEKNKVIQEYFIECIEKNVPVTFSKYGDGEFFCAFPEYRQCSQNCDNDSYTDNLSLSVKNSFKYVVENTNSYIGMWHDNCDKWEKLVDVPVNWTNYHVFIIDKWDTNCETHAWKVKLFTAIKTSPLKKIIVCNELLVKSQILLNIDHVVVVPFNNWFDEKFDSILEEVSKSIGEDGNHIVMTCCGMSAKVLIAELSKKYPKGIYFDIGSGLDKLCTKKDSRGVYKSYEELLDLFKDIIPDSWNDPKYDYIYDEASTKLGIHL